MDLRFLKPISVKNKIRIGPTMDGGYVVYKPVLKEINTLVTYGVGWDIEFEKHYNEITASKVFMFDPTMFGRYILDLKLVKILFFRRRIIDLFKYGYFVWEIWRELKQLRKRDILFVNEGLATHTITKYDTLENHSRRFQFNDKNILLKIDIEGEEYGFFENLNTQKHFNNVSQMIIEFHDLHEVFPRFKNIICRLKEDYEIVHIHGNNWGGEFRCADQAEDNTLLIPKVLEITLVRKGEIRTCDIVEESFYYPSKDLDYPNNPDSDDLSINFI